MRFMETIGVNYGCTVNKNLVDEVKTDVWETINHYLPDTLRNGDGIIRMLSSWNGTFWKAKGWIIEAMKKHPNYNGRLQLVFPHHPMNRYVNRMGLKKFKNYIYSYKLEYFMDENGIYNNCYRAIRAAITACINYVYDNDSIIASQELADNVNAELSIIDPESPFIMIKSKREIAKKGMKITRIVQQIAIKYGLDKHVNIENIGYRNNSGTYVIKKKDAGWNYQFMAFADAATEITKYGTFIVSVHPLDYLLSSNGYKWTSCHTLDKFNIRGLDNNHHGIYMGGTLSYMLDDVTVVAYYLPDGYNGDNPELEEKLKRCMFYIGEDKVIQGRVYPDGRDYNDGRDGDVKSFASDIRNAVLEAVRIMFGIPKDVETETFWGTRECELVVSSNGVQYPDYYYYDDCNVTYFDVGEEDGHMNKKHIVIGDDPICPECGMIHNISDNLFCDDCQEGKLYCQECSTRVDRDIAYYIDGNPYCGECATTCQSCYDDVLINEMVDVRARRNSWSNMSSVCQYCADNFYVQTAEGELVYRDDTVYTEENNYHHIDDDDTYCVCDDERYHDVPDGVNPYSTPRERGRIRIHVCNCGNCQ